MYAKVKQPFFNEISKDDLNEKKKVYKAYYLNRPNEEKLMKSKLLIFSLAKKNALDQYVNVFKMIASEGLNFMKCFMGER